MKFQSKYKTFHSWKCIWKYRLQNGGHFFKGGMSWLKAIPVERAVATLATLHAGLCYEAQHSVGQNIQWRGKYTFCTKTEQYIQNFFTSTNGENYLITALGLPVCLFVYLSVCNIAGTGVITFPSNCQDAWNNWVWVCDVKQHWGKFLKVFSGNFLDSLDMMIGTIS